MVEPLILSIKNKIKDRLNYLPIERNDTKVLNRKVASSGLWSAIGVGANMLLNLVRSIIFARLLMPADFGMLTVANILTQFVLIFASFGVAASVIYQKTITKADLSTCWWGNIIIDSTAAVICILIAFITSNFNHNPKLFGIVVIIATQFVINSTASINQALLRREMKFKEITIIKISDAIAIVAVGWFCVAILELGVYGLCIGMLIGSICMAVGSFILMPWIPSLSFSIEVLKKHFGYGSWFLGINLAGFANNNLDRITINNMLNKTQLGYYEYANNIPLTIVNQLSSALNTILFSAFSGIQENFSMQAQLLKNIYKYNSIIIFPILTGISLVAYDFILIAYTEKWLPIIIPMKVFCLYGIINSYAQPFHAMAYGTGKIQLLFKWTAIYTPINLLLLYAGIKWMGTTGAVCALCIYPIFIILTVARKISKEINFSLNEMLKSSFPAIIGCIVMAAIVMIAQKLLIDNIDKSFIRLCISAILGALIYISFLALFYRSELSKMFSLLFNRIKTKTTVNACAP